MENSTEKINALTQEQREKALHAARIRIVGAEPQPGKEPALADYERNAQSRFPQTVTRVISALSLFMLVVAFLPSAMRLHEIGRLTFAHAIADASSVYIAALCIVLMAEVGQVIFSLASAVNSERIQRIALGLGALVSTCIALAGNAEIVQPWVYPGLFIWLETFAPPVLVLITAQILKSRMLHAVEVRYQAQQVYARQFETWQNAYAQAVRAWKDAYENAHLSPKWSNYEANALWNALRHENRRSTAVLRALTEADRYQLIVRERNAEHWYERTEQQIRDARAEAERIRAEEQMRAEAEQRRVRDMRSARVERSAPRLMLRGKSSGTSGGVHTGETDGHVRANADGTFTGTCPYCATQFVKNTKSGASNALSAHIGRWCEKRKSQMTDTGGVPGAGGNGRAMRDMRGESVVIEAASANGAHEEVRGEPSMRT